MKTIAVWENDAPCPTGLYVEVLAPDLVTISTRDNRGVEIDLCIPEREWEKFLRDATGNWTRHRNPHLDVVKPPAAA